MMDEFKMPARVQLILKTIANPRRLNVLQTLNTKGSLPYSELKAKVGYRTKNESGKFAYHLRYLRKQNLVHSSKNDKQYTITNLGKEVLSMVKQVEERAVVNSSQMYVRTSDMAIEEFNADKILQSLVREGHLSTEMAQRVTSDVEGRIRKYDTSHLTGPLIREMVNAVLLEMGQEEYRSKMTRLGIPTYDLQEMLTGSTLDGLDSVIMAIGKSVLNEYLLTNTLAKDITDMHMSGDIHINDTPGWSLVPDTLFIRATDLLDHSMQWGSDAPRIRAEDDMVSALSTVLGRISWEASGEVVVDGLVHMVEQSGMSGDDVLRILASIRCGGADITLCMPAGSMRTSDMLATYQKYVKAVKTPKIRVVVNTESGNVDPLIDDLVDVSLNGGIVTVSAGRVSGGGVTDSSGLDTALKLHSMSVNMPRLAYNANNDERYFRTLLSLRIASVISALKARRNSMADITRRGLNPFLAAKTRYGETGSVQLLINLVGLREAVADVMKFDQDMTHRICLSTITTASDKVSLEQRETMSADICMVPSGGSTRLVGLDARRHGKRSIPATALNSGYGEGMKVDVREAIILRRSDGKAAEIQEMAASLGGGLYTELVYHDDTPRVDIAESIKRLAPICGFTLARR